MTLGVDGYSWLHGGAAFCALEAVQGRATPQITQYFLTKVRMLLHFGVKPYIVFDGDNLPSKAGEEQVRRERRVVKQEAGMLLLKAGEREKARIMLSGAVDITPVHARQVIEELKRLKIPYIVAPYEADAQLVYLEKIGIIDGIIAEDSDMLAFGAKRLVTKLDKFGNCDEIDRANFGKCTEVSLVGWTDKEFRHMCILSGCDYLPSPVGIGLKRAHKYLKAHKTAERAIRAIELENKYTIPPNYLAGFQRADLTFQHQRVFCPLTNKLVMFSEPTTELPEEAHTYIGPDVPPEIAIQVAAGDIYPKSKKKIDLAHVKPTAWGVGLRQVNVQAPKSLDTFFQKSIPGARTLDNFFKEKASTPSSASGRTPLAELDPNSLTPSPLRRLLHTTPSGVSVDITSTSALYRTPSTPTAINTHEARQPWTAPAGSTTTPAALQLKTPRLSAAGSGSTPLRKKRRLCDETDPDDSAGTTASPYFAGVSLDLGESPGLRRKSKLVEVWTDPTEEAAPTITDQLNPFGDGSLTSFDADSDTSGRPDAESISRAMKPKSPLRKALQPKLPTTNSAAPKAAVSRVPVLQGGLSASSAIKRSSTAVSKTSEVLQTGYEFKATKPILMPISRIPVPVKQPSAESRTAVREFSTTSSFSKFSEGMADTKPIQPAGIEKSLESNQHSSSLRDLGSSFGWQGSQKASTDPLDRLREGTVSQPPYTKTTVAPKPTLLRRNSTISHKDRFKRPIESISSSAPGATRNFGSQLSSNANRSKNSSNKYISQTPESQTEETAFLRRFLYKG
jgi:5'-3' exonuclease